MLVRDNLEQADESAEAILTANKWPTRLISLVHPFNLDEMVDQ